MKNIFNIYTLDLKNTVTNSVAALLIGGLAILPSLYAWFNIAAAWDPYGKTENIKVGIVNQDSGTKVRGQTINAGDEVVNQLKKNHDLGWQFVGKKAGMKNVRNGDFYATVIIPKDFSKHLGTILFKHPKKAKVAYYVNDKKNAIAPKITSKGASAIVEKISSKFVDQVNGTIFNVFNDVGVDLEKERPDIQRAKEMIFTIEKKLPGIKKWLDQTLSDANRAQNLVHDAQTKLPQADKVANNGIGIIDDTNQKLAQARATLNDVAPKVKKDLHTLQDAANSAHGLIGQIKEANLHPGRAKKVLKHGGELLGTGQNVTTAMQKLLTRVERLGKDDVFSDQIKQLEHVNQNLQSLQEMIANMQQDIDQGNTIPGKDLKAFQKKAEELNEQLRQLSDGLDESTVRKGTQKNLQQKAQQMQKTYHHMNEAMKQIADHTDHLSTDDTNQQQKLNKALGKKQASEVKMKASLDELAQLSGDKAFIKASDRLANVMDLRKQQQKVTTNEELDNAQVKKLRSLTQKHRKAQEAFNAQMVQHVFAKLDDTGQLAKNIIDHSKDTIGNWQDFNNRLDKWVNRLPTSAEDQKALVQKLQKRIKRGISVTDGIQGILANLDQLSNQENLQKYIDRLEDIQGDLGDAQKLAGKMRHLIDQGEEPTKKIINEMDQLTSHVNDRVDAFIDDYDENIAPFVMGEITKAKTTLHQARGLLTDVRGKIPKVKDILNNADAGLKKGKKELNNVQENYPFLNRQVNDLADKIRKLASENNLSDIIDLLKNKPNQKSQFLADPVELSENKLFSLPNYGAGMNPFYTTLAIWVGGLLLVSLLAVDILPREGVSETHMYFGRLLTFLSFNLVQSAIITLGDIFLLGVYIAHPFWFVIFGLLSGFVFMTIIYTLVSLFGNIGKAMAIILLVLQIAGSGGTYPVQLLPDFFKNIYPYLPFTYAIDLMREAAAGIVWENVGHDVMFLCLFGVIAVLLGTFLKKPLNARVQAMLKKSRESGLFH